MSQTRISRTCVHAGLLVAFAGMLGMSACGKPELPVDEVPQPVEADLAATPESEAASNLNALATEAFEIAAAETAVARLATRDNCMGPESKALGIGLSEFSSVEAMKEALPGEMLYPDEALIPDGFAFEKAYHNAGLVEQVFTQSTMGILYLGEGGQGKEELSILYYSQAWPLALPPRERHEVVEVNGHEAYLFHPPFRESLRSVQWLEGCRYVSVIGDVAQEQLLAIADSLSPATDGD